MCCWLTPKLLAAGLLAHLNGQTPARSGKLSVWKPIKEQEDILMDYIFQGFKKRTFKFIRLLPVEVE